MIVGKTRSIACTAYNQENIWPIVSKWIKCVVQAK